MVAAAMTRLALLLAILIASDGIAAGEPLVLKLVVSRTAGEVRVVASATNNATSEMTFCGLWGFEIVYVPDPETAVRIAREDSIAHTSAYVRCHDVKAPRIIDLRGSSGPEHWVTLFPGAAYSDTTAFALGADSYREWPGVLEVRYYLDMCEPEQTRGDIIPRNGRGGTLIARIPVPPDGI